MTLPENRSRSTQGHHYINFVDLESPMPHAKFQEHRTLGSGGVEFLKVLTIYGHLGRYNQDHFYEIFVSSSLGGFT